MIEIQNLSVINQKKIIDKPYKIEPFKKRGIYFLIFEKQIVYVGQSKNVHARVSTHLNSYKIKYDSYNFILVEEPKSLDNIEAYFIAKFKPKYNSTMQQNSLGLDKSYLITTKRMPRKIHKQILKEYQNVYD
jgi:excinuclease UvrABC nuclease subunit